MHTKAKTNTIPPHIMGEHKTTNQRHRLRTDDTLALARHYSCVGLRLVWNKVWMFYPLGAHLCHWLWKNDYLFNKLIGKTNKKVGLNLVCVDTSVISNAHHILAIYQANAGLWEFYQYFNLSNFWKLNSTHLSLASFLFDTDKQCRPDQMQLNAASYQGLHWSLTECPIKLK